MAESWDLYKSLQNRFRSLATTGCSICFKNQPSKECKTCGYVICAQCSSESTDCPICAVHKLSKKHNVDWDFKKTFPNPCPHCFQPRGLNHRHEDTCGFILKQCYSCDKQLCAKDLLPHVRLHHAQMLKKVPYHYDGIERIVVLNPIIGFNYEFARCAHNQLFWEMIEHDPENQKCTVVVVWVPSGELAVKFRALVKVELKKSVVSLRGKGFCLEKYGSEQQWMVRLEIPTKFLRVKCDLLRRNATIRLCIEREPSARLSI